MFFSWDDKMGKHSKQKDLQDSSHGQNQLWSKLGGALHGVLRPTPLISKGENPQTLPTLKGPGLQTGRPELQFGLSSDFVFSHVGKDRPNCRSKSSPNVNIEWNVGCVLV